MNAFSLGGSSQFTTPVYPLGLRSGAHETLKSPVYFHGNVRQLQQAPTMSPTAVRFGMYKQVSTRFIPCNIEAIFQRK